MIQFYNDAYLPLMAEKHPTALGQAARECWKEAWHIIGPQFEAAYFEGAMTYKENVLVPVMRDGRLQDVYWTYSYSPVSELSSEIAGVFIGCHDVNGQVLTMRNLRENELQAEHILQSIGGCSDCDGCRRLDYPDEPCDEMSYRMASCGCKR